MRFEIGFITLSLALATACSDDGLANQSSGQVETSTTSGPNDDALTGSGSAPSSGPGLDGDTTHEPPAESTTAASDGPVEPSSTGSEELTGTTHGIETDTETESTTGGPSQACIDGCAVEHMCGTEWASAEECVAWCEANLVEASAFSPFCRDAWEALSACLATLDCDELEQWQNPTAFPYPCSNADVVLSVECKGQ
jgi:hypothetical protein